MTTTKTIEIVICPNCKGEGYTIKEQMSFYNSDYTKCVCEHCNGHRVVKRTITTSYESISQDKLKTF